MRKILTKIQTPALALALALSLLLTPGGALAAGAEIQTEQVGTVTGECTITMPEELADKAYRITDGLVETYQTFAPDTAVAVGLPQGAQGLYLEWYDATTQYTVTQLGADGSTLSESPAQPFINAYYALSADASSVLVTFTGKASLSTLAVYGAGELPDTVQQWKTGGAADLMIVASTPAAALDEFFGVVAAYTVNHAIPTSIVVMSRETRGEQNDLLAALWSAGVDTYPTFGTFQCDNNALYNMVRSEWGRKAVSSFLKEQIAAAAPKVVVTQPDDETAADGAAQLTGEYARSVAVEAGVSKIYFASAQGATTLDYSAALDGCGGRTVTELAAQAFALCVTRHVYEQALTPADTFLLEYSAVGDDAAGNDLLENIDVATLSGYVDPTPVPTATPEPTPTIEPTAEPTAEPAAQSAQATPQPAASGPLNGILQSPTIAIAVLLGVGVLLTLIVYAFYGKKRFRRRRTRKKAVFATLLPIVVCALAACALLLLAMKAHNEAAALPTAAPTIEPTAVPMPTPEPTAVPESEAEPETGSGLADEVDDSANDEYYRAEGDPEEVIVVDEENGHWEYRTDTLSILIDRVETQYVNNKGDTYPLVYFVANIRMRDVNQFRTVQAADNRNGTGAIKPWILARRNKAVLMVTGDNLVESDSQYKSILVRGGKVFLDSDKCDTMAMYPDMTMRIYAPYSVGAADLLMDGVRDAFSFGPTLVIDGALTTEDIDTTARIANETNPRTGIGMVEPGHFVVIVADGRQKDTYSYGMRLTSFGQLFVDAGCQTAYNLDGGVSACMLFMGEQLNHHGNNRVGTVEDTYQRRIPDGLVWGYSELVPSEDDPIYHRGEG